MAKQNNEITLRRNVRNEKHSSTDSRGRRVLETVIVAIIILLVLVACAVALGPFLISRPPNFYLSDFVSTQYVSAIGSFLTGLATLLLGFAAFYTAIKALSEYREKNNFEKARWLSELYTTAFLNSNLKEMRRTIDFEDLENVFRLLEMDLENVRDTAKHRFLDSDKLVLDAFTDYLNFFEFIGLLKSLGRLSDQDIQGLFDYYLRRLVEVDTKGLIRQYLDELNFQYLVELIDSSSDLLFVYGTLRQGGSLHKHLQLAEARLLGSVSVKGTMYRLPDEDYPAVVLEGANDVSGELYRLKDPLDALQTLDEVEGCSEGLFRRTFCRVSHNLDIKEKKCWIYVYQRSLGNAQAIKDFVVSG